MANIPSAAPSFCPTTSRLLPLCRRSITAVGSLIATASPNQSCAAAGACSGRPRPSTSLSSGLRAGSAGTFPSNTHLRPCDVTALLGQCVDRVQILLAPLVGQPDHLERMIPFDQAVGVVVNRLARRDEQPGRRVVFAQDQVRVGLAALQGDAHRHLPDACCGPAI